MPESFLSAFFLLLLVLDPLGNTVSFLALTKHLPEKRRRRVVLRECLMGTAVLISFALLGGYFLRYTGVTQESLGVTGGVLLFLIGLKMLYKGDVGGHGEEQNPDAEPFLVPLALPLFAGPSSIALTVLNAAPGKTDRWGWISGMIAACLVSTVILLCSGILVRKIGDKGVAALERLMGLVLTTVAVQMMLDGFRLYWATLKG